MWTALQTPTVQDARDALLTVVSDAVTGLMGAYAENMRSKFLILGVIFISILFVSGRASIH